MISDQDINLTEPAYRLCNQWLRRFAGSQISLYANTVRWATALRLPAVRHPVRRADS